jgi:hypothetical protein
MTEEDEEFNRIEREAAMRKETVKEHMTKDEALRMALEALEELNDTNSYWWQEVDETTIAKIDPTITAIKQALAEPVQKPVATKLETQQFNCFHVSAEDFQRLKALPVGAKLYTTPPAAPVQEPDHGDELTIAYMSGLHRGKELAPQRQWVGLTDEEIEAVWKRVQADDFHDCVQPFAQAIEAKLRSKNT